MLPKFPQFKPLELFDRLDIESVTSRFLPFSDFNFTSLWSWDDGTARVSLLDGNLVIYFPDYVDASKKIVSVIGHRCLVKNLRELLKYGRKEFNIDWLQLVPECVTDNLLGHNFSIKEDVDNDDYVISLQEHCDMVGADFKKRRNMMHNFLKQVGDQSAVDCQISNLLDDDIRRSVVSLFIEWSKERDPIYNIQRESDALYRFLSFASGENFFYFIIRVCGQLAAFAIVEKVNDDWAIIHFEKTSPLFKGVSVFLDHNIAKFMYNKTGVKFLNLEQDLGVNGLRHHKLLQRPARMLKKFSVTDVIV